MKVITEFAQLIRSGLLYFHTLRYLKAVQLRHLVNRPGSASVSPHPTNSLEQRSRNGSWVSSNDRDQSLFPDHRFHLLNREVPVDEHFLATAKVPALVEYHLHYFDDLNAKRANERQSLHRAWLDAWVGGVIPGSLPAWAPYPTSLRVVNWIKWHLAGHTLDESWRKSLWLQAAHLSRHVEWHLFANHLFVNGKALIFAGMFFEDSNAAGWLARGRSILSDQLTEQVLPDGGHFERSPMYHALILEDVLDLINLSHAYGTLEEDRETWSEAALRMLAFQQQMTHPDGELAFFNDAALSLAPRLADLQRYAEALGVTGPKSRLDGPDNGVSVADFPDTGYLRVESGPMTAILDVAPLGPDYQPGHGHADTLSFELSLAGQRVFVNSGTSTYEEGEERLRQRGTMAHNTVTINGQDSSEVWKSFRVARRAKPFDVCVEHDSGAVIVSGAHDGYRRLRGRPVHRRTWRFAPGELLIRDQIEGRFDEAVASFHLHPDVQVAEARDNHAKIVLPTGAWVTFVASQGVLSIEGATWHPEFNLSTPNTVLRCHFHEPHLECRLSWAEG